MREPVYLIFGIGGLLGKAVYERLCEASPDHRIFFFEHSHADISRSDHMKELFNYIHPTVVINCAAISTPEICEYAHAGAFGTNSVGPKTLAQQCERIGAKLVHFSTADVFDGKRFQPYGERHKPKPISVYGKSKLEGENVIKSILANHLIIRTGWVFHADAPNFLLHWMDQIDRKLSIAVRPNTHGSPVFAFDLVDAVRELIDRGAKGVFHVANSQAATWEDLAEAVVGLVGGGSKIKPISSRMLSHMPPTPQYSVLSTKKFTKHTGIEMRPWTYSLKQCLFCMERYKP